MNVGDVDALHARSAHTGATILVPPSDRPWGRDYEISDTAQPAALGGGINESERADGLDRRRFEASAAVDRHDRPGCERKQALAPMGGAVEIANN